MGNRGALGGDRTHNPCLRRAVLYPLSYERTGKRQFESVMRDSNNAGSILPQLAFRYPVFKTGHKIKSDSDQVVFSSWRIFREVFFYSVHNSIGNTILMSIII